MHSAALPFTIRRGSDIVSSREITSTHETVHGLLRLDEDRIVIQWRTSRAIDRVGSEIRTDKELDAVREVSLPLSALANAEVRWSWLRWPPGRYLVLTGADLRAFEALAGAGALELRHPAELVVRMRREAKLPALEFASEVRLALADRALKAAEDLQLPPGFRDRIGE
ncbi:MAG TPA: hypothetical protein VFO52_12085 [Longimicrobiales bacterium]|nr:hypothetical protein [Longimicrobiales bacterium]